MEKQFIPYELAVKLKELGFDEDCLCFYLYHEYNTHSKELKKVFSVGLTNIAVEPTSSGKYYAIKAPLWQQVFDWFREKYYLYYSIFPLGYNVNHIQVGPLGNLLSYGNNYNYEEARQACLEKLIELVEKQNND